MNSSSVVHHRSCVTATSSHSSIRLHDRDNARVYMVQFLDPDAQTTYWFVDSGSSYHMSY